MENGNYLYSRLTSIVIKKFYNVYNELGFGFLEQVYQNALYFELIEAGLYMETQKEIDVYYKDKVVGKYYADMLVNDVLVLELKAVEHIIEAHELQLINYLKATDLEIGLLLNFAKQPAVRRKIFTNDKKKRLI